MLIGYCMSYPNSLSLIQNEFLNLVRSSSSTLYSRCANGALLFLYLLAFGFLSLWWFPITCAYDHFHRLIFRGIWCCVIFHGLAFFTSTSFFFCSNSLISYTGYPFHFIFPPLKLGIFAWIFLLS